MVSSSTRASLNMQDVGARIRTLRMQRGLSLEDVARRAGVSRSMLSAVERGTKVPSILIMDHIATALDSSIARLIADERTHRVVVLPRDQQDVLHDPSGWERRILSPVLSGVEFELMRTTIDPGVNAGTFAPHARGSREYVAIEHGTLRLTINSTVYTLNTGDSIYYDGDCSHTFANPASTSCIYYLAMDVAGDRTGHTPAAAIEESAP